MKEIKRVALPNNKEFEFMDLVYYDSFDRFVIRLRDGNELFGNHYELWRGKSSDDPHFMFDYYVNETLYADDKDWIYE